jgi:hypothetical protein
MQGNHLFEYAVIRIVPRPEREEFLNAGVILYCAGLNFLQMQFTLDPVKLQALHCDINIGELQEHLHAFEQICTGKTKASPIARLDNASRFRWLTATRSTALQTSKVHPGFCEDPQETLKRLHDELVV